MGAIDCPAAHADAITWKSKNPVWVEQWPLTEEKIQAAHELVQDQLRQGHIEPSNSPWNSPIFVVKKKSGKWRLLQDLRKVNETMELMGALQPGLPTPAAIPKNSFKIIIDLKDCFYTIPLHPDDCKRFAFSVPSVNFKEPMMRYHWKVLPQGMANSPTLCQKFVAQAIAPIRLQFPEIYVCHYMDDILLASMSEPLLLRAYAELERNLQNYGLVIAPEKIQHLPPFAYLGFHLQPETFSCQKIRLRVDSLKTLNDFQKFLGDINWIRPYLKITTGELKPLFDTLKGDSNPTSSRRLTPEARQALTRVEIALSQHNATYCDYTKPWSLCIFATQHAPTAVLWQDAPLRWIHLPSSPSKALMPYHEHIACLIQHGREDSCRYFGREPFLILVPYTQPQITWLFQASPTWGLALAGFSGKLDNHYPASRLLQFYIQQEVIFPKVVRSEPLTGALTIFTDGSASGKAAYVIDQKATVWETHCHSAQEVELQAVYRVLTQFPQEFNLYSDSQYVVNAMQHLETVPFIGTVNSTVQSLFLAIQQLLHNRSASCYFGHLRAHTALPGPLAKGNEIADIATRTVVAYSAVTAAQQSHQLHHQNAQSLRLQFKISREAARDIVRQCHACPQHHSVPHFGVNPRGLLPNQL